MQIIQGKLETMLDKDTLLKKYYDMKLRPSIKNEKIYRPDVLKQQEYLENDIREELNHEITPKMK